MIPGAWVWPIPSPASWAEQGSSSLLGPWADVAFIVDNFAGKGTGPNYLDGVDVGNCSSEDMLVTLDELGIETGIDIMRMLALGRVLEQVLRKKLRPFTSKNGPCTHGIVEWNDGKQGYMFVPPWQDGYFCYPKDKSQLR